MPRKDGRVLVIAGSDSGGGAGIQGDIKTITVLGGYASAAITALTAQNTLGVFGIHDVPDGFVEKQIRAVLEDIGADAIKTGMLNKYGVIETIADILQDYKTIPLVLDPVMVSKSGAALLQPGAVKLLIKKLIPRANIITPNVPEAELLTGRKIASVKDTHAAAKELLALGCKAVLLKGGHLEGDKVTDILITARETRTFTSKRIRSRHTHGTGCTLASAVATGIAQGLPLDKAVERARKYVLEAIKDAPGFGKGHGPLGHGHILKKKL
jgi:hydroxymethylpyrimidine/phosphomethylpyrimidine kinase